MHSTESVVLRITKGTVGISEPRPGEFWSTQRKKVDDLVKPIEMIPGDRICLLESC